MNTYLEYSEPDLMRQERAEGYTRLSLSSPEDQTRTTAMDSEVAA